jgi:hypothetical protein
VSESSDGNAECKALWESIGAAEQKVEKLIAQIGASAASAASLGNGVWKRTTLASRGERSAQHSWSLWYPVIEIDDWPLAADLIAAHSEWRTQNIVYESALSIHGKQGQFPRPAFPI